ncbi:MAG TPA: Verru_Chthon cassette protein B [Candidatus Methylacidiphilales bacterium]
MKYISTDQVEKQPRLQILRARHGFSLVEVAMALAIMGFASVSLIGLLPMGLHSLHEAMGNTIESQIVQNLTSDILLSSSTNLPQYKGQIFYFDDEGLQLTGAAGSVPGGTVYTATIDMQVVDSTNSPAALLTTAAYNVTVTIVNISNPSQPHPYPMIISN